MQRLEGARQFNSVSIARFVTKHCEKALTRSMTLRAALRYPVILGISLLLFGVASKTKAQQANDFVAERDLIVFVGKKLSVTERPEPNSMDQKFEARYRVLQLVFGKNEGDEITFTVYDHYGYPAFANFGNVLLFVSRHRGGLYHEKYQFFDVYPTKDRRWATCGDPYKYEPDMHRGTLRPLRIEFAQDVKNESTGAQCTEGNFVEDLFQVKKNGVLKARGLFK